jgi:hypothetical protein
MPIHLMTVAALTLLTGWTAACTLEAQTRPERTFERTLAVDGPVSLEIRTGSGNIAIHSGPTDSVRVIGRVRGGRSWFGGNVEERIRRIEAAPPIMQTADMIRIGPDGDDSLFRNISISYDVTVPMETRVQSRTGSGSQTISDVTGPVEASTGSGSLQLRGIDGEVKASTGSGHIEVAQTGDADVDVRTGSGGIDVSGARRALRARTGSGTIKIEGRPASNWDVETGSGGIRIDLPEDSAFDLNVRTGSGSINTSHPLALVGAVSRNRLRGTVRGGGARVDLSTGSGSVRID